MEEIRKGLKSFSLVVLLLVALDVILNVTTLCIKGLPKMDPLPEGMTEELAKVGAIIAVVLSFIVFLPQIYVGLKGMKIADGASSTKAFVVWTVILLAFAAIATISALATLFQTFNVNNILTLVSHALDAIIFAYIFVCTRKIAGAK